MLMDLSCSAFLDELGSASPAPGGGSVAALAGALAAALVEMVANLSIGKVPEEEAAEMEVTLRHAVALKYRLSQFVDDDTEVFNGVMAAYKMAKATEEEKQERSRAIQKALQEAALLPLTVAESCLKIMELTKRVVTKGNPNALSDGGVALLMACAGLEGAVFNVEINLAAIKDQDYVARLRERKELVLQEAAVLREELLQVVRAKMR